MDLDFGLKTASGKKCYAGAWEVGGSSVCWPRCVMIGGAVRVPMMWQTDRHTYALTPIHAHRTFGPSGFICMDRASNESQYNCVTLKTTIHDNSEQLLLWIISCCCHRDFKLILGVCWKSVYYLLASKVRPDICCNLNHKRWHNTKHQWMDSSARATPSLNPPSNSGPLLML